MKDKILKEIQKTGYPLELQVGNIFSKCGWPNIHYNRYYLDRDEQKGREIDISAYYNVYSAEGSVFVRVGIYLICEVKWSAEKPWVIFSTEKGFLEGGGWLRLHYVNEVNSNDIKGDEIDKGSSFSKFSRIGRSYVEAGKRSNKPSGIFGALTSVVKAAEDCRERNFKAMERIIGKDEDIKQICFVEPVVVLNGLLYEAYLDKKDELELNEIDQILVSFGYISSEYQHRHYLVDVVTVKELPNLLSSKKEWINGIKDIIVNNLNQKG